MLGKYLLNNLIVFDTDARTLTLIGEPPNPEKQTTEQVLLHTPTSSCLELLIENQGTILPQDELLDRVWKQKGMLVSTHTVYQNISLIRRAFTQLGLCDDVVVTIPRRGMTLALCIKVTRLDEEPVSDNTDSFNQKNIPETSEASDVPEAVETPPSDELSKARTKVIFAIAVSSMASVVVLWAVAFTFGRYNTPDYMENYELAPTSATGCKVYINANMPRKRLEQILKNGLLECDQRAFNYVTAYAGVNRFSVISCVANIAGSKPGCRSKFFLESAK